MCKSQVIFLLISLACGSMSQVAVPVGCDYTVQSDFDLNQYFGKWFEVEKTYFVEEIDSKCIEANYAAIGNGSVEVINRSTLVSTNMTYSIKGYADPLDPDSTDAKFVVNFPVVGAYGAPYWVLESDYTGFSLVLSCRPMSESSSIQTVWFLARERNPSSEIRDYVHQKIDEFGLSEHHSFDSTDQNECPDL